MDLVISKSQNYFTMTLWHLTPNFSLYSFNVHIFVNKDYECLNILFLFFIPQRGQIIIKPTMYVLYVHLVKCLFTQSGRPSDYGTERFDTGLH